LEYDLPFKQDTICYLRHIIAEMVYSADGVNRSSTAASACRGDLANFASDGQLLWPG
jgi:hypothetical protein